MIVLLMRLQQAEVTYDHDSTNCDLTIAVYHVHANGVFLKVVDVTVTHAHCFLSVCQKDTSFKRMIFLVWKYDCHKRQLLCLMSTLVT